MNQLDFNTVDSTVFPPALPAGRALRVAGHMTNGMAGDSLAIMRVLVDLALAFAPSSDIRAYVEDEARRRTERASDLAELIKLGGA